MTNTDDTLREQVDRWIRIGRYDKARRRAIWARQVGEMIQLRAGREGDDESASLRPTDEGYAVISAQLWAQEVDGE